MKLAIHHNCNVESKSWSIFSRWLGDVEVSPDATVQLVLGAKACGEILHANINDVHNFTIERNGKIYIPTFSPHEMFVTATNGFWIRLAVKRAKALAMGDIEVESFNLNPSPSIATVDSLLFGESVVSLDIETLYLSNVKPITSKAFLGCFTSLGLATAKGACAVTPNMEAWEYMKDTYRRLLEDPTKTIVGQNFHFDASILRKADIIGDINAKVWDTLHAANILYPDLPKKLDDIARVYLATSTWKGGHKSSGYDLRMYNAKDCAVTLRCYTHQKADLEERNMFEYFNTVISPMWNPAFEASMRGFRFNIAEQTIQAQRATEALTPLREKIVAAASAFIEPGKEKRSRRVPENDIKVDVSSVPALTGKALTRWLMENLGFPEKACKEYYVAKKNPHGLTPGVLYMKAYRKSVELVPRQFNPSSPPQLKQVLLNMGVKLPSVKAASGRTSGSTNEKSLKRILERGKGSEAALEFIRDFLVFRKGQKFITTYCAATVDNDSRWRYYYNIEGTNTGRSSSKQTSWGTGGNIQNIPREGFMKAKFKKCFVADEGKTIFQSDQGQAEARVVAYLSNCKALIKLLEAGEDIHVYAISGILGEDITKYKTTNPDKYKLLRQTGKFINHGGNYDMGPWTLSEQALLQGAIISPKEAEFFLAKRKEVFPEIYDWHLQIQAQLRENRELITPFGRKRYFMGKLDQSMFRKAYAYVPQSTIPHLTNLMWLWCHQHRDIYEVLQMGHDALVFQADDDKIDKAIEMFLEQTRQLTFKIGEHEVLIPWDGAKGKNWGELTDV